MLAHLFECFARQHGTLGIAPQQFNIGAVEMIRSARPHETTPDGCGIGVEVVRGCQPGGHGVDHRCYGQSGGTFSGHWVGLLSEMYTKLCVCPMRSLRANSAPKF